MSDDKTNQGPGDAQRIDVREDYEIQYWTRALNVSEEKLRDTVKRVGGMTADVRQTLAISEIPEVIIHIAPPATERGRWRVRSDGRPEQDVMDERAAVRFAADHARMVEHAGGIAIIKIERADGTWETFRP